jgi:uncharacterized protein (UPF0332 family)
MWNTYSQFDWLKFLALAKELRKRESEEETIRTCVSRAYYATYHKAVEFLDGRGISVSRAAAGPGGARATTTHDAVWRAFSESKDQRWQKIGENGDRLKRKRQWVDYDSHVPNLIPSVADESLLYSERIINELSTL